MDSPLSTVPIAARRRLAATLALFAVLLVAVGVVAASGHGSSAAPVFSAIALLIAGLLALVAWGLAHSVRLDRDEQRLDRSIEDAVAALGGGALSCGCGHQHDPAELHVTDAPANAGAGADTGADTDVECADDGKCAHDGSGAACTHDCQTCVLTALRR